MKGKIIKYFYEDMRISLWPHSREGFLAQDIKKYKP